MQSLACIHACILVDVLSFIQFRLAGPSMWESKSLVLVFDHFFPGLALSDASLQTPILACVFPPIVADNDAVIHTTLLQLHLLEI